MANRFLSIDDLTHMPTPRWLVDGLFEVGSLVMLAGPPASFKSFLALDWTLCMASGRKWHGRPTVPSKVLYMLGEGKASLMKRIQAWGHYNQLDDPQFQSLRSNFRVTFDVPQLASKASVDNMLAQLQAEAFTPDVIVVDTFARSFVGLDENSQKDTGMWIESADRLRQSGYTVIFLHHTARNTEFGVRYRGSSAILGAMDTAFTMQKDGQSQTNTILTCTKQKDHDEGEPLSFSRLIVNPNPHEEGSIVLIPSVRIDERFTVEFKEKEAKVEEILNNVMKAHFESDRARARELAAKTGMTEGAAQTRISRLRRKNEDLP